MGIKMEWYIKSDAYELKEFLENIGEIVHIIDDVDVQDLGTSKKTEEKDYEDRRCSRNDI